MDLLIRLFALVLAFHLSELLKLRRTRIELEELLDRYIGGTDGDNQ